MTTLNPPGIHKKCHAHRTNGEPCKAWAMLNGTCRVHGGKSLKGIASPTWKTGKYSKYIPERLQARYIESLNDPELLSLREDISVLDARQKDILMQVDTGEAGRIWKDLQEAYADLLKARAKLDAAGIVSILNIMGILIERGNADWAAWHEYQFVTDNKRKLGESERKRLIEMQLSISIEQANSIVARLGSLVLENVTDKTSLRNISEGLIQILTIPALRVAE